MDEVSAQLQTELRSSVIDALGSNRPVLHHLNADSSWLLQIPRPQSALTRGGRYYFNILVDPWLSGPQSDLASWFSQQWHATDSKVGSISAAEELLRHTEILASGLRLGKGRKSNVDEILEDGKSSSFIDVVIVSHEFTDHCHKDTLLEVDKDVPVIATEKAAALIKSWSHFRQVSETPPFGAKDIDWHTTSTPPLPDWVGISRLVSKGDALYYHSAVLIAWNNGQDGNSSRHSNGDKHDSVNGESSTRDSEMAEALIYTPHGIDHGTLNTVATASPSIRTLAFLHGLHDISLGKAQQLNLGAHNGLQAQRVLNAKYWVGTHDEIKRGGGLVSWFLKRKVISVGDALEQEKQKSQARHDATADGETSKILQSFEDTHWIDLENGESKVLL